MVPSLASLRLTPQQAERTGRRWRMIAAIAAAHVAAVLLVVTISDQRPQGRGIGSSAAAPVAGMSVVATVDTRSAKDELAAARAPARR